MLSKAHLTSHSRMSGSRSVITPLWLSGSWRSFLYSSSVYSCHLFLISSASVRSNHLILCCPLLLCSIFPSIRVFANELALQIRLAKVLEVQLQHQSFQWIFRIDFLKDWQVWSPYQAGIISILKLRERYWCTYWPRERILYYFCCTYNYHLCTLNLMKHLQNRPDNPGLSITLQLTI